MIKTLYKIVIGAFLAGAVVGVGTVTLVKSVFLL